MTPMERLERLRDRAAERGDTWEAGEMQKQIDELSEAIRCTCGAIITLEILPHPDGWCESWHALFGSYTHFTTAGPSLMERHRPDYIKNGAPA